MMVIDNYISWYCRPNPEDRIIKRQVYNLFQEPVEQHSLGFRKAEEKTRKFGKLVAPNALPYSAQFSFCQFRRGN